MLIAVEHAVQRVAERARRAARRHRRRRDRARARAARTRAGSTCTGSLTSGMFCAIRELRADAHADDALRQRDAVDVDVVAVGDVVRAELAELLQVRERRGVAG